MSYKTESPRLDHLDAVRAFALLLGIVFHASLSFLPFFIGWAVMDESTSPLVAVFALVSHSFRMEVFFLIAGFFSHMTFHRSGYGGFLRSRCTRIVVPFVVGWFVLRPLIVSGWIMGAASMRGDVDVWAGLQGGFKSFATLPAGIFVGSHLWFLYYLMLITVAVLAIRAVIKASGAWHAGLARRIDGVIAWLSESPFAVALLALPTAGVMWFMQGWGMDTPDKTLLPGVPVLMVYSGFFAFGWMIHRRGELLSRFGRLTASRWLVGGAGIGASILLAGIEFDPGHQHFTLAHAVFAVSYAVMMWSLVFLTVGVFEKLVRRANAVVRYVADASYWLYLVHLPIIVWLQVAFAELPLHWTIKLVAISVITIGGSLLSYDLFVRSTFIGRILNGRRRERVLFPFLSSKRADRSVPEGK